MRRAKFAAYGQDIIVSMIMNFSLGALSAHLRGIFLCSNLKLFHFYKYIDILFPTFSTIHFCDEFPHKRQALSSRRDDKMFLHCKILPSSPLLFPYALLLFVLTAWPGNLLHAQEVITDPPVALNVLIYSEESFQTEEHFELILLKSYAEARQMDFQVTWVDQFPQVLKRLGDGEGDIAAGGFVPTPERLERFVFSEPYFPVLPVLIQYPRQAVSHLEELSGLRVAVLRGSANEDILRQFPEIELVFPESIPDLFSSVAEGRADALATDSVIFLIFAETYPGLQPTLALSESSYYSFALPPGSPLKESLDAHLMDLRTSGKLREIVLESFSNGPWKTLETLVDGLFDSFPE